MRIGILGGSFDPVHHGHLLVAIALAERLALSEVRLVVARQQPLKAGGHGASPEDRAAMTELAVAGHPLLRADRSELGREGPSYTVDTLRAFRRGEPQAEWFLLLGVDAARDLPQWHESAAIPSLAQVKIFSREGVGPGELQVPRVDISSTAIRERVRSGRSIRYWVPEVVADYIAAHGLYRSA